MSRVILVGSFGIYGVRAFAYSSVFTGIWSQLVGGIIKKNVARHALRIFNQKIIGLKRPVKLTITKAIPRTR